MKYLTKIEHHKYREISACRMTDRGLIIRESRYGKKQKTSFPGASALNRRPYMSPGSEAASPALVFALSIMTMPINIRRNMGTRNSLKGILSGTFLIRPFF